jgi:tRNA (guanine-N7-)-methyltransferase
METYENVFQYPYSVIDDVPFDMKGQWHEQYFKNEHPIVLELGCGRGEYTVGLGRMRPDKNYIGVDIKGARMWTGAREALESGMTNVGFLRTQIEFIDRFFAPGEVSEIWLTFSDPQMKKATKRLTSTYFLQRYRRFMQPDGLVHLKTDSRFLYTYTVEMLCANSIPTLACTDNLYGTSLEADTLLHDAAAIQTYYEQMWRQRGIDIKYLCFRLPQEGNLVEPDVEIPLDDYRSYSRAKRSSKETGK